jgi:taurine dioxygenase
MDAMSKTHTSDPIVSAPNHGGVPVRKPAALSVIIPDTPMGVEIRGLDIRTAGDEEISAITNHLYARKLVVIRDQLPSDAEYVDFARKLGTPQIYLQPNYHHPAHKEIFVSSNELYQGQKFGVRGTGRYWHTDYSFMPEPLPLTMLRAKALPRGVRETYYIDMSRVLEALPADLRAAISPRRGIHEGKYRYKVQATDIDVSIAELLEKMGSLVPPVLHPCVIEHPVTGKKVLYLNRGFTTGIEGLAHEDAQEVLGRIFEFTERSEYIHTHTWAEGDVLLWDNRYLLHKAGAVAPGETSTTYRIGIYDNLPFYAGLAPTTSQIVLDSLERGR